MATRVASGHAVTARKGRKSRAWPQSVPFCVVCGALSGSHEYAGKGVCVRCVETCEHHRLQLFRKYHKAIAMDGKEGSVTLVQRIVRVTGATEAARLLHVSQDDVFQWAQSGTPEAHRYGVLLVLEGLKDWRPVPVVSAGDVGTYAYRVGGAWYDDF